MEVSGAEGTCAWQGCVNAFKGELPHEVGTFASVKRLQSWPEFEGSEKFERSKSRAGSPRA